MNAPTLPQSRPPLYESELIFPPEHWHNHASCIVECPNGDLLVCWYNGSGERRADDVKIEGARKRKGAKEWSPRFLMADTPGFPDTNPCMFIDPRGRLWLLWQTIIANEWHTALTKYKISSSYQGNGLRLRSGQGAPRWDLSDTLVLKPGPEFAEIVAKQCDADEARLHELPADVQAARRAYLAERRKNAADKYFHRMGWMTRAHPFVLEFNRGAGGASRPGNVSRAKNHQRSAGHPKDPAERPAPRLIVPLYSDGFDFSIMALSDDWGATWTASAPLVSLGGIQPSIARRRDGTLVTYMRDNGPPPKRLLTSTSRDEGKTWSPVVDTDIPNPGSGAEVINLRPSASLRTGNGNWLLAYNDTERGRHSLAVSLSDDEGKSWKWTRHLEANEPGPDATHAGYPSIMQAKDGTLHATYTYTLNGKNVQLDAQGRPKRECIKHVRFNEAWVKAKD